MSRAPTSMNLSSMLEARPSPSSDSESASVLDPTSLDQLRQLDPTDGGGFVVRVLGTYARSLDKQMVEARKAFDSGQWDQLARAAHTLKSASASVGALAFSQICADIEHRIRGDQTAHLGPELERFFAEAARVRGAVLAHLGLQAS